MAAPTADFLNQASEELIAVLKDSPDFMSPEAKDAPEDANGVIVHIEDDVPETDRVPAKYLPHCGVVYLGDEPVWEDSAASDTDYEISLGVRFYARGSDRRDVWRKLKQATAALAKVVAYEMSPNGSQFNGFATLARYMGGDVIDTEEPSGYGAILAAEVRLQISLPDYEDTPGIDPDEDDEDTP